MKILEVIKGLWTRREQIREISNIIIRVIDAVDGVRDWQKIEKQEPKK